MEERYLDDPDFQIELLRKVLKFPEDLIIKIVSLNHGKALEHILTAFTVYYPKWKEYGTQDNLEIIKGYRYTDIDNYSIGFSGVALSEYECCYGTHKVKETGENLHKEFDAYCEIMSLILKYIDDRNDKAIEELLNRLFPEENEKNKEEENNMERKFNCTKEQAMAYDFIARIEERTGRRIELPRELKIINERVKKGGCEGVILTGGAGSGKLTYANLMAKELNAPVFQLSLTSDTRLEDFYLSKTFSEPIEKGGFLIIDGIEFCHESVKKMLESWFLCTLPGRKLEKPKLDVLLDIPEYIVSPNFVLVLLLDSDYWEKRTNIMSRLWFIIYPDFVVPNKIHMEGDEEQC